MYENWKLKRWETPISDVKHLFMDSFHDHAEGLEIELSDWLDNIPRSRFKVTFRRYPVYRSIDESYRLELWQRYDEGVKNITGWTLTVPDSPWIKEFANEPILHVFHPEIIHYMIMTEDDVIEVLSDEAPTVERIA